MTTKLDVLIVGAGFAGLYALHKLRGMGLKVQVVDAAGGIGGTWYWNSYPGARCDVESFQYSYSFDNDLEQEWEWTERYAGQGEILSYLKHVVKRFNLGEDIVLNNRVESASYHDGLWQIKSQQGDYETRYMVMASGCLSVPNEPAYPGLENFQGEYYHSGRWPVDGPDLSSKKVAVIGTGSSGVQIIGELASKVKQLTVFQRTPHWVVPAGNHGLSKQENSDVKADYKTLRHDLQNSLLGMKVLSGDGGAMELDSTRRQARFQTAWDKGGAAFLMSFNDLLFNPESNLSACEFIADKIKTVVDDSETAATLTPDPKVSQLGARRMVQDDHYYSSYNLDTVSLVDTRQEPIESFTSTGIKTSGGEYDFDVVIFAIGFDALTGALLGFDVHGEEGLSLGDKWQGGARSYLGIAMHGFPNFFTVTGPGSPSVFSNMLVSIEQHVDWIVAAIAHMEKNQLTRMEANLDAENAWVEKVAAVAQGTVIADGNSWYLGSNIPGKPRVILPYLGGVGTYRQECDDIAAADYQGFSFQ